MNNYVVVQEWMLGLGLSASEMLAFAVIWGFTQDGRHTCHPSLSYIAQFCGLKEKSTVSRMLKRIAERGYLKIDRRVGELCEYSVNVEVLSKRQRGVVETTTGVVETTTRSDNNTYIKLTDMEVTSATSSRTGGGKKRKRGEIPDPPTMEEVEKYAAKLGITREVADRYWNAKQTVSWMNGSTPITEWWFGFKNWVEEYARNHKDIAIYIGETEGR